MRRLQRRFRKWASRAVRPSGGGTALWVLKGNVLFLVTVHAPLEGVFKDMDEMDTALEKKNLDLSRHAAGLILGRLQ